MNESYPDRLRSSIEDRLWLKWFEDGCPTSWYPLDDEIVEEVVDKA